MSGPSAMRSSPRARHSTAKESINSEDTPLLAKKEVVVSTTSVLHEDEDGQVDATAPKELFRQPSVTWLLPALLVHCLAVGATAVPKTTIILNVFCYQHYSPQSRPDFVPTGPTHAACRVPAIQSQLARFMLLANMISGFLCAISSPRLCTLSNRFGRKKIMAVTAFGMLFGDTISIVVAIIPDSISAYWILLEFAIGGLSGTLVATMAVAQIYAADCTPLQERSTEFGCLHSCIYIGAALGPVLGGILLKYLLYGNLVYILCIAAVCHVFFISFVLFAVPESLPFTKISASWQSPLEATGGAETPVDTKKRFGLLNVMRSFFRPLSVLYPAANTGTARTTRRDLILLAAIDALTFGVLLSTTHVLILYSGYVFSAGSLRTNLLISTSNTVRVVSLVAFLPVLSRLVGSTRAITLCLMTATISTTLSAFASTYPAFVALAAASSISALASPTAQALLTWLVPAHKSSELMGALSLVHALTRIVLPPLLDLVYSLSIGKGFDGTIFLCIAGIFAVTWIMTMCIRRTPG